MLTNASITTWLTRTAVDGMAGGTFTAQPGGGWGVFMQRKITTFYVGSRERRSTHRVMGQGLPDIGLGDQVVIAGTTYEVINADLMGAGGAIGHLQLYLSGPF